jgi:alkylresorcinol/alkylpyrone synthase
MVTIAAVSSVLPIHSHDQAQVTQVLSKQLANSDATSSVLSRVHQATQIDTRHFVLPIEEYQLIGDFTSTNALFVKYALALAEQATIEALDTAGLSAAEVDHLFFTTVTGIGAPALDVLLAASLGFRPDLKRIPSFGLGCVAGAAGIARVADYLKGHPEGVALVVSVELCSLTLQWQDRSMANFVGTGIFADGAAAVVMVGDNHRLSTSPLKVLASRSVLYPDTQQMIGWKIGSSGFSLMLEAGVPELIEKNFSKDVDQFLEANELTREDIDVWLAHPGGPKVLDAFSKSLELEADELSASWSVMKRAGNMSSAAILHVLKDVESQPAGTRGLLFALGPGVSAELVLLEWA